MEGEIERRKEGIEERGTELYAPYILHAPPNLPRVRIIGIVFGTVSREGFCVDDPVVPAERKLGGAGGGCEMRERKGNGNGLPRLKWLFNRFYSGRRANIVFKIRTLSCAIDGT